MFATNAELTMWNVVLLIIITVAILQICLLILSATHCFYYHVMCPEVDYPKRYGKETWVIITGGSSGQGRRFAFEFAARGFNLLLIGSKRSFDVQAEIEATFVGRSVQVVLKDFTRAWEPDFFDEIEQAMGKLPPQSISFLINNVGHRVAWAPHHTMPRELIHNTIACGTITQAMMTRICLPYLLDRPDGIRSGLISITAQCMHPILFSRYKTPKVVTKIKPRNLKSRDRNKARNLKCCDQQNKAQNLKSRDRNKARNLKCRDQQNMAQNLESRDLGS
jgi:NADP-dependent 3-hydroxy acid dehydrogenase YdfG